MPEQVRAANRKMPSTRLASSRDSWSCASTAQPPEILAVADQDIEGVEFDLMILFPAVQPVKIRSAIDAEQHCLAIDHER